MPSNIQRALSALQILNAHILLHPLSVTEINRDENKQRKNIILSMKAAQRSKRSSDWKAQNSKKPVERSSATEQKRD
jgi:hypothetical protein